MDLRTLINQILGFVGATSLTDVEFDTIGDLPVQYTSELYTAILTVLDSREAVSDSRIRLNHFFKAKGISIGDLTATKSNIFVGSPL